MHARQNHMARLLLASALTLTGIPLAAAAEGDAPAGRGDLEEIVVSGSYTLSETIDTATGLGLTLQETPQSVSVMTDQRIRDQALDSLADVVANAVGVSVSEIDNVRNNFYSRGFEVQNYQVDGVPLSWSLAGDSGETIADVALYDHIEFVRGATGLMTGAGDPSASINLVRKHADATELTGFINLATGSWKDRQVLGDVGMGLNAAGTIRARVVGKYEASDSFVDFYEDKKTVLYGVLEADVTDGTLLRVGASYQNSDPTAPSWGALPTWFSDGTRTDFPRSQSTSADWTRWETTNKNYFANLVQTFGNGWQLRLDYNRLDNRQHTELLYIYGLLDRDTGLGLVSWPYKSEGKSTQDSFDAQLKGGFALFGRTHDFVLGALHSEQTVNTMSFAELSYPPVGNFFEWDGQFPYPGFDTTPAVEQDLKTSQTGFYGATRLNITDRFKLIGGGRIAKWKRTGKDYEVIQDFGDSGVFIPYAGALYDLTDHHRLYVSYTEIFKPQNARDENGDYLDPLEGKSAEVGLKSSFLGDMLNTSIALFRIEQDNLAQTVPGTYVPGHEPGNPDGNLIQEASRGAQGTVSKGFEFEVVGQPVEGWNISFGYTQYKAHDADDVAVNTDQPRKLLTLFTTYRFNGVLEGLTAGGGVNWQSSIYSAAPNPVTGDPERLRQGSYALVNLMARYDLTQQLYLQFNLENLFDKTYYSQVGFYDQYRYGAPRNFNVGLTYQF